MEFPRQPAPLIESSATDSSPFGRLVRLARAGVANARTAVFIHAADGGVASYLTLASLLGESCNAYGIAAIGFNALRTPPSSIVELAQNYADLLARSDVRPNVIVGWSSGGWIAFETAKVLFQQAAAMPAVVILDTLTQPGKPVRAEFPAPRNPELHQSIILSEKWRHYLHLLTWQSKSPQVEDKFWGLPEEDKAGMIFARRTDRGFVSNFSMIRDAKSASDILIIKDIIAMICMSITEYAPSPYSGYVHVFYSEESESNVELLTYRRNRICQIWSSKSAHSVRFQLAPGNHGAAISMPVAKTVASRISSLAHSS